MKKISSKWIGQTREFFRDFTDEIDFPDPYRTGERWGQSSITLKNHRRSFFKCFLNWRNDRVISADKMINEAKGPVRHKKQKEQGTVPKKRRGFDKEATLRKSHADGWVYGAMDHSPRHHI